MTRLDQLSAQLAQACSGRENHSDLVSIQAVRLDVKTIRIFWEDSFIGQRGILGRLSNEESRHITPILLSQMRAWRARCEGRPIVAPLGAKAAAGGAR